MQASILTLIIAATSPSTSDAAAAAPAATAAAPVAPAPVVVAGPALADTSWSVGGGLGFGGPVANIERRLTGPVWMGVQLGGGFGNTESTTTVAQPGNAPIALGALSDAWNAGADVRFRLQLLPDTSFLRPSLFLGGGLAIGNTTIDDERVEPGESTENRTGRSTTFEVRGDFGALLDITLLPWLALRASSTLVRAGYVTRSEDVTIEQAGVATITSATRDDTVFANVALQPAVAVQAFF